MKKTYSDKVVFCVRYLKDNGITVEDFNLIKPNGKPYEFDFVRVNNDFYVDLAKQLRELWPPGEKDGKYPWRDSVSNLAERLRFVFTDRKLEGYSIGDCLAAAHKYLARFEEDTKYMKTLKYFIFKQKNISAGCVCKHVYESEFADILEGKKDYDTIDNEWNDALNSCLGEGELI